MVLRFNYNMAATDIAWSRLTDDSSQRHFQPRLGRATVVASYFDYLQAPTRWAPIEGSSFDAHLEIYFSCQNRPSLSHRLLSPTAVEAKPSALRTPITVMRALNTRA
jgi:hypothetical protein